MSAQKDQYDEGDFVRPSGGNAHIVTRFEGVPRNALVHMACGKTWGLYALWPASGDHGRQCEKCREAF